MKNLNRFIAVFILAGCGTGPSVISLLEDPHTLGNEPIVLNLEDPIYRKNQEVDIRMEPLIPWSVEPPFEFVRLEDGTLISVKATLVSDRGSRIESYLVGSAGQKLNLRFDKGPSRGEGIVRVELTASEPLEVTNVNWVDWNPK